MTTASIIFCVAFTAVMAPMMWRIWKQLRRDRYLDSVLEKKRLNAAGLGPWPADGYEATAAMALQSGDWRLYEQATRRAQEATLRRIKEH